MEKRKNSLNISAKSFLAAIGIIFLLMVATYALTFLVPGGEYARTMDEAGHTIINTEGGFRAVEGGLPFYKWILSPFLVLRAEGSGALIAVIAFLLIIGGVFNALHECGLMGYMLQKLAHRFGAVRYRLMSVLVLFFMAMGSLVGSFEEVVPLVPIVTSLAVGLGWDVLTGVAMSLLAAGCGFAAGVANPFTIGVAQTLAGLPMFSGIWLRLVAFVCIYLLLLFFVRFHARRLPDRGFVSGTGDHVPDTRMDKGLLLFGCILGAGIALVLSSGFIPALRDYTMIIVAVMFLVAGVAATLAAGMGIKGLLKSFLSGLIAIAPSVLMILMAASIRYTLVEGKILDSLLHWAVTAAGGHVPGVAGAVHLRHLPGAELFHSLRLRQGLPVDPADRAAGWPIWRQQPDLHSGLRLRGWVQQRVLPHQPVPLDLPGPGGFELRQVGQIFGQVPAHEPGAHLSLAALRPGCGVLNRKEVFLWSEGIGSSRSVAALDSRTLFWRSRNG